LENSRKLKATIAALTRLVQLLEQDLQQLIAQQAEQNMTPQVTTSISAPTIATNGSASFASPTPGAAPLTVGFNEDAGGTSIDFGDGSSASLAGECSSNNCSISHVYQKPGTYTARILEIGQAAPLRKPVLPPKETLPGGVSDRQARTGDSHALVRRAVCRTVDLRGGSTLPNRPSTLYYRAEISLEELALHHTPAGFRPMPGMAITADVKVGTRSIGCERTRARNRYRRLAGAGVVGVLRRGCLNGPGPAAVWTAGTDRGKLSSRLQWTLPPNTCPAPRGFSLHGALRRTDRADDAEQHARQRLDESCWQCHHRAIMSADPVGSSVATLERQWP
jgi:hypothetical protein